MSKKHIKREIEEKGLDPFFAYTIEHLGNDRRLIKAPELIEPISVQTNIPTPPIELVVAVKEQEETVAPTTQSNPLPKTSTAFKKKGGRPKKISV